jgi:hypothetical protein
MVTKFVFYATEEIFRVFKHLRGFIQTLCRLYPVVLVPITTEQYTRAR